ncbi:MAG: RNase adapter RapZ [Deltaproteobacteria bacterium]|nr:MAG: RNase adapter RapZ [Deltaproteobacteria bacterium]
MIQLVVVTGQSGAGKSTCLAALDDSGFHCVDNLPIRFLPELAEHFRREGRPLAVGIDARDPEGLRRLESVLAALPDRVEGTEVLFVSAEPAVLLQRFATTRRRHPLGDLPDALDLEMELLAPLRRLAHVVIDTSRTSARTLRQIVRDRYGGGGALRVALWSFGFAYGILPHADLVFDARFLENPHDDPELRDLTGLHAKVAEYVLGQDDAQSLLDMAERVLGFWGPRVRSEGRAYLTFAIGCTGGRHRSVALVEALAERSRAKGAALLPTADIVVRHRDLARSIP